jgi:hypothetical protein
MFRRLTLATGLLASPALAAPYYQAELVAKPAAEKFVARDTMWKCGEAGCIGGKSGSRPAIVCAVLVREAGALRSFSVEGKPLAPDQLEKCNAAARR